MEDKELPKCFAMDEGSDTGSKSVVAIVSGPTSISAFLTINTEAWENVTKAFRDMGKAMDAGLDAVRPLMQEAARAQKEAYEQFRREYLGEWDMPSGVIFTRDDLLKAEIRSREMQEKDRECLRELFEGTSLAFSIQNEPRKTMAELLSEVEDEGLFPELKEMIEKERREQIQLHKKKGKKVKNWEHNKFWQGRK